MEPIITGIILFVGACKGASDMFSADSNRERAERKNTRAIRQLGESFKEEYDAKQKAGVALIQLANRKRGIIQSSIQRFIDVYRKLKECRFNRGEGLDELSDLDEMVANIDGLEKLCLSVNTHRREGAEFVSDMLSSTGTIAAVGALTGFVYLGGVAGAVDGALIFATNPVLGPVAAVSAITGSIERDSKMELQQAKGREKFVDVYSQHAKGEVEVARAIYDPAMKQKEFLTKCNNLFMRAITETEKIIEKNGKNKELYSVAEKEYIRTCLNLADAIGKGIRAPLYDKDSNLTKQAQFIIAEGNKYLQHMEKIMTR